MLLRSLNILLPEGSAARDFIEVGSMLASGVSIGLLCSSIGGVVMDTLGFIATLVLFFAAGFYFLTRKVQQQKSNYTFVLPFEGALAACKYKKLSAQWIYREYLWGLYCVFLVIKMKTRIWDGLSCNDRYSRAMTTRTF